MKIASEIYPTVFKSVTVAMLLAFFAQVSMAATKNPMPKIESRYTAFETFARAMFYIETMYVDQDKVDQKKMIQDGLRGIVDELDPHTMIMPKRAFDQLTSDTQGKFGGVGIIVSQERGKLTVVSPIEDTPAQRAGIKSGDEIVAIDGISLKKLKGSESVDKMRGLPGSTLKLTIKRKSSSELLEFALKREIIKVRSVHGDALAENVFYIRITSFQENTTDELVGLLRKYSPKMQGLILDLRDNPGGLLEQSVSVVDQFVESGLIVSTVGRDRNRIEREFARKRGTFTGFPIVVLLNDGSASASEIVAGALQDHQRALILGVQSFGKGSVQTLVTLPDGSGLKLTVARYYTPKDRSIQAKGITPDIHVAAAWPGNSGKKSKKESNLAGHITSSDLSNLPGQKGMLDSVKNWPNVRQKDHQLVTAFTYLKGWSIFQKPTGGRAVPNKSTPKKAKGPQQRKKG